MFLFMASLSHQPSFFHVQEDEVAVPSVQANLQHCQTGSSWSISPWPENLVVLKESSLASGLCEVGFMVHRTLRVG